MESIFMSQHGDSYFPEEPLEDYPFWQVDAWFKPTQTCSPAFSHPFKNGSALSPAQDALQWMYMSNAETPMFTSPATEVPPTLFPTAVLDKPNQAPAPSPKHRRSMKPVVKDEVLDRPIIKRIHTRRSKSFSPGDKPSADDMPKVKEDMYQERSRMASNKFRARKRSEIAQLESEEYTIEDANRNLRSMLDSLTSEILSLKMQILQHTNCNCELIQEYINKEALNFVQNMESVSS